MIGTTLKDRYYLESEIGRGGMGVVFGGRDRLLKRRVAVKVLSAAALGSEGRARLLQEAQAIASLNHPNIVTVYDAGEVDGNPFIVMELIEGQSLHDRPPQDLDETLTISRQICAALEHAHDQGIIHRDLKPENVLIAADGMARLVDFGLARSVASRLTDEGTIMGTVFYMAPELALGREFNGRADLYALGIMLYEWATGQLPFSAQSAVAVISQHINAPVVPPRVHNQEIPLGLESLILQLLAKEPGSRPVSATAVSTILDSFEEEAPVTHPAGDSSMLERIVRGRLVGREGELAEARAVWRLAAGGQGQVLLISGEPGIGKTRLTRELVTQVEVSGGQALIGECYAEGGQPYGPIAQILRNALAPEAEDGRLLPDPMIADLLTIATDLQLSYADVPANPPLAPEAQEQRLFESVATLFLALSEKRPLLLVLEDAHWADSGSLSLLRYLARRNRGERILMAVTYREAELERGRPFNQLLHDLNREKLATRLKLTRLDRPGTQALLATLFAEEITPDFLESIYRETEGNPFFVEEVCKALVESGALYFEEGRWRRPSIKDMAIPQSVRMVIEDRLAHLSKGCRDILTLASVIGREFEFDLLLAVSKQDEDSLLDLIDEALDAQLILEKRRGGEGRWTRNETFEFQHALIAHTLYEDQNRRRQARAHEGVGLGLEQLHSRNLEAHAYQLAHHFFLGARGQVVDRALKYLLMAADRAEELFAHEEAVAYLEQAITLLEDEERNLETLPLWERLGDIHTTTINRPAFNEAFDKAIKIWESLTEDSAEIETGLRLYTKVGEGFRWAAIHPEVDDFIQKGLAIAGEENTLYRARLLTALAFSKHHGLPASKIDFPASQAAAEEAVAIAQALDDPEQLSASLDALANVYGYQGDNLTGWKITKRRLKLLDRLSVGERNDTLRMAREYLFFIGEYARSEEYGWQAQKLGVEQGLSSWQLGNLWGLVFTSLEWDRWEKTFETMEAYIQLDDKTGGQYWSSRNALPGLTRIAKNLSQLMMEPQRGKAIFELAAPNVPPREDVPISSRVTVEIILRVDLLIGLGLFEEAGQELSLLNQDNTPPEGLNWIAVCRAEIRAYTGNDSAFELFSPSLEALLERHGSRQHLYRGRRALGIAHARQGEFDLARKRLNQALDDFIELDTPWQQGRTLLEMGKLERAAGDEAAAQVHFQNALDLFESMKVRFHAEQTRGLLVMGK